MDVLIVLETSNGVIHRASLEAVAAVQAFARDNACTTALMVMSAAEDTTAEMPAWDIGEILLIRHDLLKAYNNDGYAQALCQVIAEEKPQYVFMGHSYQVRDYMPKVSAKMGIPFISDVIAFRSEDSRAVFTKPVFNGRLQAEFIADPNRPCLVSFQAAAYSADEIKSGSPSTRNISVDIDAAILKTQAEKPFRESTEDVDLSSAKVIVGVGRGMAKEEHIPLARSLADALGAELGCSRPVVDSGLLPASRQIGSSGQTVAPDLYLALGISGSAQHVMGMKASKTIIAINKDPEAPIFEVAEYGVVADALEILPQLTVAIKGGK